MLAEKDAPRSNYFPIPVREKFADTFGASISGYPETVLSPFRVLTDDGPIHLDAHHARYQRILRDGAHRRLRAPGTTVLIVQQADGGSSGEHSEDVEMTPPALDPSKIRSNRMGLKSHRTRCRRLSSPLSFLPTLASSVCTARSPMPACFRTQPAPSLRGSSAITLSALKMRRGTPWSFLSGMGPEMAQNTILVVPRVCACICHEACPRRPPSLQPPPDSCDLAGVGVGAA
ncbi:hypothetical protein B0H16DRAFT_1716720 [Mycena metata]|uniref:Uncharacterized protein n=1 Tax=Mycena metata TaxID=1033252 RepID=A0AAD7NMP6_9AGAR|nr:hypothetical protein B0H16DRAFT_1716720 [Mycena metata]